MNWQNIYLKNDYCNEYYCDECYHSDDCPVNYICDQGSCHSPCNNGDDCGDNEYCCDAFEDGCETGYCYYEEDGIPACIEDCSDETLNLQPDDNGAVYYCENAIAEDCFDDCVEEDFYQYVLEGVEICTACLAAGNCEEVFAADEEGDGEGPPACMEDCAGIDDVEEPDNITDICSWYSGIDATCFDDCTGEEAEMATEIVAICTCFAATSDQDCSQIDGCGTWIGTSIENCDDPSYTNQSDCEANGFEWMVLAAGCYPDSGE